MFRPTKGLCSLFRCTGTRVLPRKPQQPPPVPSTQRRSFVEVVREGSMEAQGFGKGDFGEHGGGRGRGGFNPGFQPGFGGGGRNHGYHSRGRGNYGGGRGGYPGYGGFGGYQSAGYLGHHGAGRGRRPHGGGLGGRFGGGRGRGNMYFGGHRHHLHMMPPNQEASQRTGAGHNQLQLQQNTVVMATGYQLMGGLPQQHAAGDDKSQPLHRPQVTSTQEKRQEEHQKVDGVATDSCPNSVQQREGKKVIPEVSKNTVPPNVPMNIDVPESSKGVKKNKGKPYCYRCLTKGHTLHDCLTMLCCDICCDDHVVKNCPNMKKTTTSALPFGYAVEGLGFYFIPAVNENPKEKVEEKLGVVRVLEGSITADLLAVELEKLLPEKLLPGKHKWEIEEKGVDAFTTNFPSADWLDTVVNWGPMNTKTLEGKIQFEKNKEEDVCRYEIEKVWVQFKGLPMEFREFPIIWAIASILGVPRSVDIKFTKAFGRARLKVAVLDSSLIPDLVDVVIGDYVYQLHFGVEQGMSDGEPVLLDLDSTYEDDDPRGGDTETKHADLSGKPKENLNGDKPMDIDGKREEQPRSTGKQSPSAQQGNASDGFMANKNVKLNASAHPTVVMTPDNKGQWQANLLNPVNDSVKIYKLKGQKGGTVSPGRSSKRSADTADQDSLEKAARLKARQNLEHFSGKGTLQGNVLAPTVGKSVAAWSKLAALHFF
ncbi:uncharacterized protein LOC110432566 [Sorghum bicolor]|uniref:uncharacterized protein LOC110432566 n=1 Tax=Sorghum bicolor TaxID=4558 RepID=UPI000B4243A0|nr:uncharacterized protein LOC110432566 [Sorghum bicolor]|eukprot:XP_021308960.1 uncharacterized protein LOC110432566 [Sorghum bicolor]